MGEAEGKLVMEVELDRRGEEEEEFTPLSVSVDIFVLRLFPRDGGTSSLDSSNQSAGPVHPFHPKIRIRRGILATECADVMQQFFQLRRKKNKKEQQPSPSSWISTRPPKFFARMHDVFSVMFCL